MHSDTVENRNRLFRRAGALLGRRAYSRGELRRRLEKFGSAEEVEATLDRLAEVGLLNDTEYAYNFAFRRIRHEAWGAAKVRRALGIRHVPPESVEAAIERVHSEVAEDSVLSRYLDKLCSRNGFPANRKGIQKLVSHLRNRGFDEDRIWNSLRDKIPAEIWRRYDTGD
jgi:regulatory protein